MREVPRELREALQADSVQALSSAVSQGLCIDACYWHNDQQRNLLQLAAGLGAPQCTAALLAAGAPIDAASPSDGCTALHCACSNASSSTARVIALLVRGGADKAARNHAGRTPCELLEQGTSQVRPNSAPRGAGEAAPGRPKFPAAPAQTTGRPLTSRARRRLLQPALPLPPPPPAHPPSPAATPPRRRRPRRAARRRRAPTCCAQSIAPTPFACTRSR